VPPAVQPPEGYCTHLKEAPGGPESSPWNDLALLFVSEVLLLGSHPRSYSAGSNIGNTWMPEE